MQTGPDPQARRSVPGRLVLVAALLAALLAGVSSPLSFLSGGRVAAQTVSPTFVYQSVFNGAQFDSGHDEVVDGAGNAYVLARAYDTTNDVMVVKFSPSGAVLFTTYLRGSLTDYGTGLALDGNGGLLVAGWTDSSDFPIIDAIQPVMDARRSGFIARLAVSNGAILSSSFFGGNSVDEIHDVGVGPSGEIYLVGSTESTDFPTVNPLQASLNTSAGYNYSDAFIVRLSADAHTILYSTYLGGEYDDQAGSVGLDAAGDVYVAGTTSSDHFPTANPVQPARSANADVWAARLSPDGANLEYSTYLGGSGNESLARIAVNSAGYAILAGTTDSSDFPTTPAAYQPVYNGGLCGTAGFDQHRCTDAYVAGLAPDGSQVYGTYLGDSLDDEARGVAVDDAGNAYVIGYINIPGVPAGYPPTPKIFVDSLDASGSSLLFSVLVTSAVFNDGHGIAVGPGGDVFFTGAQNAPSDVYAARLTGIGGSSPPTATPPPTNTPASPTSTPIPTLTPTPSAKTLHVSDLDGGASRSSRSWKARVTILVQDAGNMPVANVTVRGNWSNGYSGSAHCTTGSSGTCTLTSGNISLSKGSVTFTVSNLARSGFTYNPAANGDPEGDSNGTTIVVSRP
jgi:hypothetical protein